MSSASSPPDEGDEVDVPVLPKRIRLSEIEEIAAERLEGATEGSLKEALAVAPVDLSTLPEPRIGDAVEAGHTAIGAEAVDPVLQTPPHTVGEPLLPDTAGLGQTMEPAPSSMVETMPAVPVGPEPSEARPEPVMEPAASVHPLQSNEPSAESVTVPATPVSPQEPSGTVAEPVEIERPVVTPEMEPDTAGSAADALPAAPAADAGTTEAVQPLASALGAAAKLAADANAAAEALENLKRLLERQLPNPVQAPLQWVRAPHAEPAASAAPSPLSPEPLSMARPAELPPVPARPPPRAIVRYAAVRERRQLDIRGFMAGFALSWAIGAALYIYLTAG